MIPTSNLFYTPESLEDLMEYCERFNGQERVIAMTIAQITMNLCAKLAAEDEYVLVNSDGEEI
jgi:hypothetical protein